MNERTPEPRRVIILSKVRESYGAAYLEATKREGEEIPVDFFGNEHKDTTGLSLLQLLINKQNINSNYYHRNRIKEECTDWENGLHKSAHG